MARCEAPAVTPYELLRLMRDVPGVAGSCLVDPDGRVLVRDLPAEIDNHLLTIVGRRAHAVLAAVAQPMPGSIGVALRFSRLTVFCGRAGRSLVLLLGTTELPTTSAKAAIQASAPALARVVDPVETPTTTPASSAPRRGDGIWG